MADVGIGSELAAESYGFSAGRHFAHLRDPDFDTGHRHTDIEIQLWDRPVKVLLGGRILSFPERTPIVIWAGSPHLLMWGEGEECPEVLWITVPLGWLKSWQLCSKFSAKLIDGYAMRLESKRDWTQHMSDWVSFVNGDSEDRRIAYHEIQAFLLRIQREHQFPEQTEYTGNMPQSLVRATVYVMKNYHREISASDVADALQYNSKYLTTAFRRHLGVTLHSYLNKLRVMEAQRLLRQTNYTVTRIAMESGFGSASRFYAAFRKYTGRSPRNFRNSVEGDNS